jgi:hypothetical protein
VFSRSGRHLHPPAHIGECERKFSVGNTRARFALRDIGVLIWDIDEARDLARVLRLTMAAKGGMP